MIGAHQDDNEFECGGLAAKLIKAGHTVQFLSMCNGCGLCQQQCKFNAIKKVEK